MISPKRSLIDSLLAVVILLLTAACADKEPPHLMILDGMNQEKLLEQTSNRTIKSRVEESTEVRLSVVYTGDLEEILFNSTSHLRALIENYELQLVDPFEIDNSMKGITLYSHEELEAPLEIAKEISQCEEVLMVEVKNLSDVRAASL